MEKTAAKDGAGLVAAGKATRFDKGNKAALGHGHGRPRKALSELLDEVSHESIRELRRIAFDAEYPRHAEHGFDAVKELAKLSTPRRREVTGDGGAPFGELTFMQVLRQAAENIDARTSPPVPPAAAGGVTAQRRKR